MVACLAGCMVSLPTSVGCLASLACVRSRESKKFLWCEWNGCVIKIVKGGDKEVNELD